VIERSPGVGGWCVGDRRVVGVLVAVGRGWRGYGVGGRPVVGAGAAGDEQER